MALCLLGLQEKWIPEYISGAKARLARNADNPTAIYEPTV
jgi:hypothetical protein